MRKHIWWLGLTLILACSRSGDPEGTDSSTHWLDVCRKDSDCGDTLECLCGVCVAQCETQNPCKDLAADRSGVCATLNCDDQGEIGVCTVACSNERPCPKNLDCQDGVCVPDMRSPGESSLGDASLPESSNDSTAPPTLDEFAAAFLEATCQFMIHCPSTDDDQQRRRLLLGDVESCIQNVQWLPLQRDVRARVEATRSGLFSYDAALAQLAIERVRAACNLTDDAYQELYFDDLGPEVFDGKVELQGACNQDVECRGDAYCERPDGHCGGSCQPRRQLGQECTGDPPCSHTSNKWPLACDFESTSQVCEPTIVISGLTEGEGCTVARSLGSKAEFRLCAPNLFCSRDQEGTCKPLLKRGERCFDQFDVCEDGAKCEAESSSDAETVYFCRALQVERTVGNACDDNTTYCDPFRGLVCNADTQMCALQTDGSLGSPCYPVGLCALDLYCDRSGEANQCRTRRAIGDACDNADECESEHCASDALGFASCAPRYCSSET